MPFHQTGFLGKQAGEWTRNHRQKWDAAFRDLEELNSVCLEYIGRVSIKKDNGKHITAAALFSRCLEVFESVVVLLERGFANPVRALLRVLLEPTLNLGAIATDGTFWLDYVHQDQLERRKTVNVVRDPTRTHFDNIRELATPGLLTEIENEIATDSITKVTAEETARRAGMIAFYDTMYRTLSAPIHTRVREIERHLVVNSDGVVEKFNFAPDGRETGLLAGTAATILCNALTKFSGVIAVPLHDDLAARAGPPKQRLDELLAQNEPELPDHS